MSAVMLLPGTNGSLLLVQRTVTRTIVLQETIGKGVHVEVRGQLCGVASFHLLHRFRVLSLGHQACGVNTSAVLVVLELAL
ncbi:hypothetical protein STEG23_019408 [Scotinomys teguina]